MVLKGSERQGLEYRPVVFAPDRVCDQFAGVSEPFRAGLVIQYRSEELLFGREVAKDHGLGDSGGLRDLLCGRAAKATLREEAHGGAQDREPSL